MLVKRKLTLVDATKESKTVNVLRKLNTMRTAEGTPIQMKF